MDSSEFGIPDHRSTASKERSDHSSADRIPRSAGVEPNWTNFMGKHRMTAAIAHLNQQIQIIQEELDQLETLGESSIVCKEILSSVESNPDALLPVYVIRYSLFIKKIRYSDEFQFIAAKWTKGPADAGWDRWFQGAHSSRNRKRWI